MKKNVMIRIDERVLEDAKRAGINISRVTERTLERLTAEVEKVLNEPLPPEQPRHTHEPRGERRLSRSAREAESLYAELKERGMVADPVRNAPAILRYIFQTRGSHPATLKKYYAFTLSFREQDADLPPFSPPPPGEVRHIVKSSISHILP